MIFEYNWKNKEANFGPALKKQISGGTHVTFEIILKKEGKYIALRRPKGIPEHELPPSAKDHPEGLLYFCHNLIRYGESLEKCVKRIVRAQAGVSVKSVRIVYIESLIQKKDSQWSIIPEVIAEVEETPKINTYVTEVVVFGKENIPGDFAWWQKKELEEFLKKYD